MKKIHTEKVRATFYIDKRLYQLMKRCSAIEGIPMSSIIGNEILEARVGKYAFKTLNDWEGYSRHELPEEMEELENQQYWEAYSSSPDGKYDTAKSHIAKELEEKKISQEKADALLKKAEKNYRQNLDKEKQDYENEKQALEERWLKAVKEIPIE